MTIMHMSKVLVIQLTSASSLYTMPEQLLNLGETFDGVFLMSSYTRQLFQNTIQGCNHHIPVPGCLSYANIEDAHHIALITAQAFGNRSMRSYVSR